MGKLLDWDNMPPVGTPVVFKGYRKGFHRHWGFQVGKTYYVGKGTWPRINYGNDFIFELAEFTKDDLKDGMRLTDRERDVWWVCGDSMVLLPTGVVVALKQWRGNLTFNDNEYCDIMKVTDRDGTVLFEREEEPSELTIEEIAKAFNLPVERVRIKK